METISALLGVVVGSLLTYLTQGADRRRAEAIALRVILTHGRRLMYANHSSRTELSIHFRELHIRMTGLASASRDHARASVQLTTLLWTLADKCWYSSLDRLRHAERESPGVDVVRLSASPARDLLTTYSQCEGMVDEILRRISRRPVATALLRRDGPNPGEIVESAQRWSGILDRHGGPSPDIADSLASVNSA